MTGHKQINFPTDWVCKQCKEAGHKSASCPQEESDSSEYDKSKMKKIQNETEDKNIPNATEQKKGATCTSEVSTEGQRQDEKSIQETKAQGQNDSQVTTLHDYTRYHQPQEKE